MTQEHPIIPPPELIREWSQNRGYSCADELWDYIATQAARWGADQELEACCEWIYKLMDRGLEWSMDLRIARRPKPPSLKEQALALLDKNKTRFAVAEEDVIRLALESLPD